MSKTVAQVLAQAIEAEITGFTTYLECARQTKDETGKNMFITLAREELDHYEILRRQFNDAFAGKPIEPIEISQTEIVELVPKLESQELKKFFILKKRHTLSINKSRGKHGDIRMSINCIQQLRRISVVPKLRPINEVV